MKSRLQKHGYLKYQNRHLIKQVPFFWVLILALSFMVGDSQASTLRLGYYKRNPFVQPLEDLQGNSQKYNFSTCGDVADSTKEFLSQQLDRIWHIYAATPLFQTSDQINGSLFKDYLMSETGVFMGHSSFEVAYRVRAEDLRELKKKKPGEFAQYILGISLDISDPHEKIDHPSALLLEWSLRNMIIKQICRPSGGAGTSDRATLADVFSAPKYRWGGSYATSELWRWSPFEDNKGFSLTGLFRWFQEMSSHKLPLNPAQIILMDLENAVLRLLRDIDLNSVGEEKKDLQEFLRQIAVFLVLNSYQAANLSQLEDLLKLNELESYIRKSSYATAVLDFAKKGDEESFLITYRQLYQMRRFNELFVYASGFLSLIEKGLGRNNDDQLLFVASEAARERLVHAVELVAFDHSLAFDLETKKQWQGLGMAFRDVLGISILKELSCGDLLAADQAGEMGRYLLDPSRPLFRIEGYRQEGGLYVPNHASSNHKGGQNRN